MLILGIVQQWWNDALAGQVTRKTIDVQMQGCL